MVAIGEVVMGGRRGPSIVANVSAGLSPETLAISTGVPAALRAAIR
jgi:hypothetical protein